MALADLLAELERDAASQAEAVLTAADAEAERIATAAASRLAARRAERLAEEEARLLAQSARDLLATRREGDAQVLAARRRALDRVFAAAARRLGEADWIDRAAEDLEARLGAALALAGDGPCAITAEAPLAERLRASPALPAAARVEALAGCGAGFTVRTRDGEVEIDDLWRGRLERRKPALEIALARAIDEELR